MFNGTRSKSATLTFRRKDVCLLERGLTFGTKCWYRRQRALSIAMASTQSLHMTILPARGKWQRSSARSDLCSLTPRASSPAAVGSSVRHETVLQPATRTETLFEDECAHLVWSADLELADTWVVAVPLYMLTNRRLGQGVRRTPTHGVGVPRSVSRLCRVSLAH